MNPRAGSASKEKTIDILLASEVLLDEGSRAEYDKIYKTVYGPGARAKEAERRPQYETTGRERDIIICAVDNHATRKLINDYCAAQLDDVLLISGGNDGVGEDSTGKFRRGTYGNCQVYVRKDGQGMSPSLTQYHAEIANPADRLPTDQSCTELLESVPQLLLTNLAAASAILNALFLYLSGALHYSELALDIADGLMQPLPVPAPKLAAEPIAP